MYIMNNINLYLYYKNGVHIIVYSSLLALLDPLLGLYLYLKVFAWHYYQQFSYLYDKSEQYRWKHLVRLTDTGHIANALFYFYPKTLPICYNVQFVICFGYYLVKFVFGTKDIDTRENPELFSALQDIHGHLTHSIPFLILFYQNAVDDYTFDGNSLFYSYVWIYTWLLFIYLPWRYYTKDSVYAVFNDESPTRIKVAVLVVFNCLIYFANSMGHFIQTTGQDIRKIQFK